MGDAEIVRAHVAMMELGVVSNVFSELITLMFELSLAHSCDYSLSL